ncbi:MAG TPA: polysaccharide deacetylase family protein [Polyangiaceae bacterium]|jgi:peptidoglycan/xylan/chitin deacetylase (PgdA/CDA1 family)|nr:polysaccharide deacetylase family protein [Polyangiaceae bacterium]
MSSTVVQSCLAVRRGAFFLAVLLAGAGCGSSNTQGVGAGGMTSTGGSPGISQISMLPNPPGASVARPSGSPGGLKVLDWAGFKSAVSYTLDDAQPSQIEHYAELAATGVRMTFFITSGNSGINPAFNATFTQAVADGHEMGNHTVHHCHADLTGCSTATTNSLDTEIDGCTDYIVENFGQPAVWTAASPFGDLGYNAPAEQRFLLNRGVSGGTIAANDATDPFNLPCHAAVEGETAAAFNRAIDNANTASSWLIFLIHTLGPTSNSWYAPIDISVVSNSVSHARELGQVWIDSMVNVGAYWRAQKLISTLSPTASGDERTWSWKLPEHFPPGKYLRVTVEGGTVSQGGKPVAWDPHGFYEIALDAGSLTLSP